MVMNLREYINERVEQAKKQSLYESLYPIVAESVMETAKKNKKVTIDALVKKLMSNKKFKSKAMEYLNKENDYDGKPNGFKGKKYTSLDNVADGSKRRTVTQKLKDKKIDYAPIAYELWPDMSQDAARSWFSKKVSGKNESFTDDEISQIYNLLNNIIG